MWRIYLIICLWGLLLSCAEPKPAFEDLGYQVKVIDNQGEPIETAEVKLTLGGNDPPETGFTDSNGIVILAIPSDYDAPNAELTVNADGFTAKTQTVSVNKPDDGIQTVQLIAEDVSQTTQGSTLPTLTNLPTSTATPILVTPTSLQSAPTSDLNSPPKVGQIGDEWIRPLDGMIMVYVPAGTFTMGASFMNPDGTPGREYPAHLENSSAFWIDKTEVTNDYFVNFLNEVGNQGQDGQTLINVQKEDTLIRRVGTSFISHDTYENHPVIYVNWYGAKNYCDWVDAQLPTEVQWEYAARGIETSLDPELPQIQFPWGSWFEFDGTRLNFCDKNCEEPWKDIDTDDGYERTSPVGHFPDGASWVGALDMAGNVWEWTADWYAPYTDALDIVDSSTDLPLREKRVVRGGSWNNVKSNTRSIERYSYTPDSQNHYTGFRCVISIYP